MKPIPLVFVRSSKISERSASEARVKPRPSRLRRSVRYFVSPLGTWAGLTAIRSSAASVGHAIEEARTASKRDPRFHTFADGRFNLGATAILFGISVEEVQDRLAARRRQSAVILYGCVALALASCGLWLFKLFGGQPASIMSVINALAFSLVCILAAFYQALINYQIRSGRTASSRDFIMTENDFWPTP